MQPNPWQKYSTLIFPLKSGKCGKEAKNYKDLNVYLKNESFLDEIKSILYSFWRAFYKFEGSVRVCGSLSAACPAGRLQW